MNGSEYAELSTFMAIAQELSFRRAAARLEVSPSAISHTLSALERRLGVRLVHRTTRSVALTESGTRLYTGSSRPSQRSQALSKRRFRQQAGPPAPCD